MPKLTAKQENFAQALASGKTQADAYRAAYSATKQKPETVQNNAYNLLKNSEVSARVKELKDALANKALWTREDSVHALAEIARAGESKASEIVSAIKELNSMHGYNEPTKHELSVMFPKVINVIAGRKS